MPTALVLTIRPRGTAELPSQLGRAAHAAILRLFGMRYPALAQRLHDLEGLKPLTVSNISGLAQRGANVLVSPMYTHELRVTALAPEVEEAVAHWPDDLPATIEIGGILWQIEGVNHEAAQHAWAGSVSFDTIASTVFNGSNELPYRWDFEFAAPVTFRQRGMNVPLPTAELVFGSLLDKWNAFAPFVLPEEVRRFASECVAINRFDLHSVAVPWKGNALQIGAVGRCSYIAIQRERHFLMCMDMLARYAFYSGVGAATTRGLGQTRVVQHISQTMRSQPTSAAEN